MVHHSDHYSFLKGDDSLQIHQVNSIDIDYDLVCLIIIISLVKNLREILFVNSHTLFILKMKISVVAKVLELSSLLRNERSFERISRKNCAKRVKVVNHQESRRE